MDLALAVLQRNAEKHILAERRDGIVLNGSLVDKLQRQGLTMNKTEPAGMRARLGAYYTRWKNEFGSTAWGLLEDSVGRLG